MQQLPIVSCNKIPKTKFKLKSDKTKRSFCIFINFSICFNLGYRIIEQFSETQEKKINETAEMIVEKSEIFKELAEAKRKIQISNS